MKNIYGDFQIYINVPLRRECYFNNFQKIRIKDLNQGLNGAKKFYIQDFFSKCDQIRSFLPILPHLLKKF